MKKQVKAIALVFVLLVTMFFGNGGIGLVNAADLGVNSTDVTLYILDDNYTDVLSIPSAYNKQFQIIANGNLGTPTYEVISGNSVEVSTSGLITPATETWYWVGNIGYSCPTGAANEVVQVSYIEGTSVVKVSAGGQSININVNVVDYVDTYVDEKENSIISSIITSDMTTEAKKFEAITKYVAQSYDYSASYSSERGMLIYGCGDCWASTYTIIGLCEKANIKAYARIAKDDMGAGSGHRNVTALCDGKVYIGDAGYVGSKPRYYDFHEESYGFTVSDSTITQYDGFSKNIDIPESIAGKTITSLGKNNSNVFYYADVYGELGIQSANIPATITYLSPIAFSGCKKLTEINVSSNNGTYTSLNGIVFSKDMTKMISVPGGKAGTYTTPSSVKEIGDYCFYFNENLKSIIISDNVSKIGYGALGSCSSLESIIIGKGVKTIDNFAFADNYRLEKIIIPSNVESIGGYAFRSFNGDIYFNSSNTAIADNAIGDSATIYGMAGSTAETYALNNEIEFVEIDADGKIVETIKDTTEDTTKDTSNVMVSYSTHIQDIGWQSYKLNGETSGTSGQSKRLEGIVININKNGADISGGIRYSTHIQDIGWQDYKTDGQLSGTTGQSKRLEAIKIELTDEIKEKYDVYYRVHCQDFGWLGWASNGEPAGTAGYSKRLEAIQICLVKKGGLVPGSTDRAYMDSKTDPVVSYRTHVQDIGWQGYVSNGAIGGTTGKAKRLEAINISLSNLGTYSGEINYSTHIQNIGWQNFVANGEMSGTSGRALRLEAIKINLTGDLANQYDIYYRVHAQDYGWLGWASNGAPAGTTGYSKRLEAIQIKIVRKGDKAPGSTANAYKSK